MQRACTRWYYGYALAALVGIGVNDWRCVLGANTPYGTGVSGHVVPVLLVPVEKVNASEVPYVAAALRRVEAVTSGVRHFYRERTYAVARGTNAYAVPVATSAQEWQTLATTNRTAYQNRVLQELEKTPIDESWANNSVRIGAFVYVGASAPPPPSLHPQGPAGLSSRRLDPGTPFRLLTDLLSVPEALALGRSGFPSSPAILQQIFSVPPYVSYADCSPSAPTPAYESAFFEVGHGLGTVFGLPRSDQYPFSDLMPKPSNVQQSIMYNGNGTHSAFFPFEACRLLPFLTNWR